MGSRRLGVDFPNDYYNPRDPNPSNRDRNLYVHNLELEGPIGEPLPSPPESHTDIFFTDPKSADGDEEAAWEILNLFASSGIPASCTEGRGHKACSTLQAWQKG